MQNYFAHACFLGLTFASVAGPSDCIMPPLKQHVRTAQYVVTGVATTNLDAMTSEGREYRWLLRNLTHQDSLSHCITARFTVSSVFKGKLRAAEIIEVASQPSEAPKFELGKRYVLFLRPEGKRFVVYGCSYSSELSDDPASAKLLRDIAAAL
jgi:hypothetical protein